MSEERRPAGGRFTTTHWSLVQAAGVHDADGDRALAALCERYWFPVYAFIRRRGSEPAAAEDLTQGFFTRLLEKGGLAAASPDRGRFRSFVLTAVKNYLANDWHREHALKRGGAESIVSLDGLPGAEQRFAGDAGDGDPEAQFEKRWALTLLDKVLEELRREAETGPHPDRFARLSPFLTGDGSGTYAQIASELQMSEAAVKVAVHRLRRRFGELLRAEVADTVEDQSRVDDELRHLLNVIST